MSDPKPTAKPLDMSAFLSSSKAQKSGDIVIHGPPKSGKTICAATASAALRTIFELPSPKPALLTDMLWLAVDAGATDGFDELGLELPEGHLIDVRGFIGAGPKVSDQLRKLPDLVRMALAAKPSIKFIVVDTVSQLDKYLAGYFIELHKDNTNNFAPYKEIFNLHRIFHAKLNTFNRRLIFLCHSKAFVGGEGDAAAAARKKATALPGSDMIQPDITGQARTVYIGNASMELFISTTVMPGKGKKEIKRTLYPFGHAGFEGSNRHHQLLDYEEPAHLGKLLAKIEKGRAK